tara:strand:+ start:225 stop:527 length:303 start_codon:yes stop_codon:yes gene_type:complete
LKNINFEIEEYNLVNFLWSDLVEKYGLIRSQQILSQANDLQRMSGKKNLTIPIIFSGTGGLALISIDCLRKDRPSKNIKDNQVLIFNLKNKLFQILEEAN